MLVMKSVSSSDCSYGDSSGGLRKWKTTRIVLIVLQQKVKLTALFIKCNLFVVHLTVQKVFVEEFSKCTCFKSSCANAFSTKRGPAGISDFLEAVSISQTKQSQISANIFSRQPTLVQPNCPSTFDIGLILYIYSCWRFWHFYWRFWQAKIKTLFY